MTDPTPTEQAAIDAMAAAFTEKVKRHPLPRDPFMPPGAASFWGCSTEEAMAVVLRAVPLDYCVQRAINEGALEPAAWLWPDDEPDRIMTEPYWGDERDVPLYRLA